MNVLLFKPGAIGDMLQLSPVFRALKSRYPDCRITLMAGDDASADLFAHNPLVDEVLVFDRRGRHRSWRAFLGLREEVRRRRFDLVVNYQRSNLKGWLLISAAMPCRVLVYRKARSRIVHAVENHLEAVAPLGIDPRAADRRLELPPGADAARWAGEFREREGLAGRRGGGWSSAVPLVEPLAVGTVRRAGGRLGGPSSGSRRPRGRRAGSGNSRKRRPPLRAARRRWIWWDARRSGRRPRCWRAAPSR
jgi:hypothetical protein